MLEVFKPYFHTVRNYLKFKNFKAFELFKAEFLTESFDSHDNWNGGIDFYTIVLNVPVADYIEIEGVQEEQISKDITNAFEIAIKDDESIQINKTMIVPHDNDITYLPTSETMWTPDHFRLFISHLSENKRTATNLKICLEKWGIQGFVAHEDIEPTNEWTIVLFDALMSMNALCAILVKGFKKSNWCDQEVGIALGQNKLCIPIHKEANPYGFLGRYQMIKANGLHAQQVAQQVAECIFNNSKTHNIYCQDIIRLLLNAKTEDNALNLLNVINHFAKIEKIYIEMVWKDYQQNSVLTSPKVLQNLNELFRRYGLTQNLFVLNTQPQIDSDELPF